MTQPCHLCTGAERDPATSIVVNNVLTDSRTLAVMGGPVCLDEGGPSQIGTVVCDHHASAARGMGYTLAPLDSAPRAVTAASTLDELWAEHHRLGRIMAAYQFAPGDAATAIFTAARDARWEVGGRKRGHDRVRRGIAHLDERFGAGWEDDVPTDERLNMAIGSFERFSSFSSVPGCGCVAAHLFGEYSHEALGLTPKQAEAYGFYLPGDTGYGYDDERGGYAGLTAAWRTELAARKAARP